MNENHIESSGSKHTYKYKKLIYIQQKITANLSVIFGLIGFVLMILENEFTINFLYDKVCFKKRMYISFDWCLLIFIFEKSSSASTIVKSFITGSTGLLLITIVYYYKLKVEVRINYKQSKLNLALKLYFLLF